MILNVKKNVELNELDVILIEKLYNLSPEHFIELIMENVEDYTNIQELISSIVTSFVNFEKYQTNSMETYQQGEFKFNEHEIVNLIDFVSATTFLVEKIIEQRQTLEIKRSERLIN